MFNRQLVLVAIDQATDLERIFDVALSIAQAPYGQGLVRSAPLIWRCRSR